jgi:hypothetical protein
MCLDLKNTYLSSPLDWYKDMHIPVDLFPLGIVEQNDCLSKVSKGCIYLEMGRVAWGLPQAAGILANNLLHKRFAPKGYYEWKQTPGLWKHASRPISFTLVVNNFGVKCTNKVDIGRLIA